MTITVGGNPPPGMVDDAYRTELTAAGGIPPYNWTPDPLLPDGLELASLSGGEWVVIQGIPKKDGSGNYAINVTDNGTDTTTYKVHLTINPKLAISTPGDLPSAVEGKRYAAALYATGGAPALRLDCLGRTGRADPGFQDRLNYLVPACRSYRTVRGPSH